MPNGFNPGFNYSVSDFQIPQMNFNNTGSVTGNSGGISVGWLSSLLGIGRDYLNYYLNQRSADTAYDRQKELMRAAQEFNASEAQKQREAASIDNIFHRLKNLGLNTDLIYQNGASQGSMSSAASAGAPTVMPANVPTFSGLFDAIQAASSMINAEAASQTSDANFMRSKAEIKKILSEVDLVRSTMKNVDADTAIKNIERSFKNMTFQTDVQRAIDEARLTENQANAAMYAARRMSFDLFLYLGEDLYGKMFKGTDIEHLFDSYFTDQDRKDFIPYSKIDMLTKKLAKDLLNGQITAQSLQSTWQSIINSTGDDVKSKAASDASTAASQSVEAQFWWLRYATQILGATIGALR